MIVPDKRRYNVTEDGDTVTLTVNQCSPQDSNNYACKASNEAGEITCHADLIVNGTEKVQQLNKTHLI